VQEIPQEVGGRGICIDTGDKDIGMLWRPCDEIKADVCHYRYLDGHYSESAWATMTREECLSLSDLKY
jgi:hypothetical protein